MAYEPDDTFDPQKLDAALKMEQGVRPDETDVELADRLLKEAAPRAALSIIDMATECPAPSVRLAASKLILDRALPDKNSGGADDPLSLMVKRMQQDAINYANGPTP